MSKLDTLGVDTLLARLLWERGVVELEDLQQSLQSARRGGGTLARELVARGLAAATDLERVMDESLGVEARPERRIGPYRLERRLGEGGMGVVWLGVHEATGAQVAVKTLPATSDPEFRDRFLREGEAQARVDEHPHVVRVHSAGSEGGYLYLVLDYAPGGDLAERLAAEGALPEREAVEIVRDLALGLAHVHAAGVLHRDLKPQNVLFDEGGRPRLVDFGLARLEGRTALTESGVVLGTPAYMAPEQAMGQRGEIGPATDVYGLGALLYNVLAGQPPFVGVTLLGILDQVLTRAPGPLDCDPALASICLRCLEKTPGDRFSSASDLAQALEDWLAGRAAAAASPRRRRVLLASLALGALALAGALVAGYLATRAGPEEPLATPRIDYLQRGIESAQAKRWRAAHRHFESALKAEPSSLEARGWRGIALRGLRRDEEALADLGAAHREGLFPEEGAWIAKTWTALGAKHLAAGRVPQAAKAYESALEVAPADLDARLGRAWTWIREGRFEEARDLASEVIALNLGTSEPYLLRACARRRIRTEIGKALGDHDRAVALAGNVARPRAERALFYLVYLKRLKDGTGLQDAAEARSMSPKDPLVLGLHAYGAVRTGEWGRAGRLLDQAEKDPPYQSAFVHWVRGLWRTDVDESLPRKEILAKARAHYREAVRIDPWCPYANLELGFVLRFSGDYPGAELHLSRGLRVMPRAMSSRRERSVARLVLKNRLGALEDFDYLANKPISSSDLIHAGSQLRKLGYPTRALSLALRGLADTDTRDGRVLRAECLIDLGRLEEARSWLAGVPAEERAKLSSRLERAARWVEVAAERAAEADRQQDPVVAIKRLREALSVRPDQVEWWVRVAELELGVPEQIGRAAYSATRGLEVDGDRLELLLVRARALAAHGDARAARADLDDLLTRAPEGSALRAPALELKGRLPAD